MRISQDSKLKVNNYKSSLFADLIEHLEKLTKDYIGINIYHCDIFEHLLLEKAGIYYASRCRTDQSQTHPDCFYLDVGINQSDTKQLTQFYNTLYGPNAVTHMQKFDQLNNQNQQTLRAIRFKIEPIIEQFIPDAIDDLNKKFSDPRTLQAYQSVCASSSTPYQRILGKLDQIGKIYHITTKTDFVEHTLLRLFDIHEVLNNSQFGPARTNFVDNILAVEFYLDISETAANDLVNNINNTYPNTCRLAATQMLLSGLGQKRFQHIIIDKSLFLNYNFLQQFKSTLQKSPDIIEKNQIKAGYRQLTTQEMLDLLDVAQTICIEKLNYHLSCIDDLKSALLQNKPELFFNTANTTHHNITDLFNDIQSETEQQEFKKNVKKPIKSVIKEISKLNDIDYKSFW